MLFSLLSVFLIIGVVNSAQSENANNACNSIEAYFQNTTTNANCWYDPDIYASQAQRAQNHGLFLEKHSVRTEDGWTLTTFRLRSASGLYGKGVIFIQHGMTTDFRCFTANGNDSIAYFLAQQGFDVWLGNYRGTDFSRHETLKRTDEKFWDFSFHEHGLYDLPANFKYIAGKTKRKILHIGHSMGSTGMAIYLSQKPREAEKYIKHAVLVSPALYLRHTQGLLEQESVKTLYEFLTLLPSLNLNVLLGTDSFERQAFLQFCKASLKDMLICMEIIYVIGGKSTYLISPERLPLALPALRNMAVKQLFHYAQSIQSGDFRMYDYGPEENVIRYNSSVPPAYDLSKISIPITFIYGKYDALSTKEDNLATFEKFRKSTWDIYEIPYNHFNFLFDIRYAKIIVLPLFLDVINKYI